MKKIVLTEAQAEKLMDKVVSEQIAPESRYRQEVKAGFSYHGLRFEGNEIDWIEDMKFTVSFDIHIDARSYGIKDINIMGLRGPESIDVEIIYYPEGSEETQEGMATVNLNWDEVKVENNADIGWIGISHDIEIELGQAEDGSLYGRDIVVQSREV